MPMLFFHPFNARQHVPESDDVMMSAFATELQSVLGWYGEICSKLVFYGCNLIAGLI